MRLAIALLAPVLVLASPAGAAEVFTVDSTKDRLDADAGDGICATAGGRCTLRAAITQANETAGNDVVKLPRGVFKLTQPPAPPPTASSNEEGDLVISEAVAIEGRGAGRTVIKQTVKDRVVATLVGGLPGAQISELTVTGGRVTAPGNQFGGGILNEGTLSLEAVTVRGNKVVPKPAANSFGGGVAQEDGILLITNSTIRDNLVRVDSETGGAIGGGISTLAGVLGILDSKVSRNRARQIGSPGSSSGGGVSMRGSSQITNSTIARNQADDGAGLEVSTSDSDGDLTLDSSTVSANEGKRGGGIFLRSTEEHSIINSTISGNSAPQGGSAIYEHLGNTDLTHATIAKNPAGDGHAAVEAGEFATDLDFYGSIVAGRGDDCGGNLFAFSVDDQNVFGDAVCSPGISTDVTANPKLKGLADNGGPTKTHALKPASPAIDLVSTGPSLPVDQRGVVRPTQESDAGSFERQ